MSREGRGEDTRSQDGFFTINLRNDSIHEIARKSCIGDEKSVRISNASSADNLIVRTPIISDNSPHNCQQSKCCHCLLI